MMRVFDLLLDLSDALGQHSFLVRSLCCPTSRRLRWLTETLTLRREILSVRMTAVPRLSRPMWAGGRVTAALEAVALAVVAHGAICSTPSLGRSSAQK